MAPYCTCSEPIKRWQYVITAIAPTVVLGLLPAGLVLAVGEPTVFHMGLLLILGGGGDLLCICRMFVHPQKGKECLFLDHPYEIGMIVFEKAGKN